MDNMLLVTDSNVKRHLFNKVFLERFAQQHNRKVFTWKTQTDDILNLFVEDSPAYILANLNIKRKLVNGSKVILKKLVFQEKDRQSIALLIRQQTDELYILVPTPIAVVVQNVATKELITIPLTLTQFGSKKSPITLGFAVTYHKIQGQTIESPLIIDVTPESNRRHITSLSKLYVALTRVRRAEHLMVYGSPKDIESLKRKEKKTDLVNYLRDIQKW
ncbi:MAG: hypothetical protein ACX93J_15640 [Flagellimonas marinaquae]